MKRILVLIIITFITQNLCAQILKAYSFAVTSEAIGLPFTNYLPLHPGIEIKGTFKKVERPTSQQVLNGNIGFFYHQKVAIGIYAGGEYQFSKKLFSQRISLDFPIGLGYLHTIYPGEVYEITDGELVEVNQKGRPHLYTNLGIGLTFIKSKKTNLFIRQEFMLELFGNTLTAIPHSLLKVGVQIKILRDE